MHRVNPHTSFLSVIIALAAVALVSNAGVAYAKQGADDATQSPGQTQTLKLRGDGTVDDTQLTPGNINPTTGVKLRGDGTVDDSAGPSSPSSSSDDQSQGVKLRGDGTVDDTQPSAQSAGVKLRGDGTVDDTQPTGQTDDSNDDDSSVRGDVSSSEHRLVTDDFVSGLLRVATSTSGERGEQLRTVAQQQDDSSLRTSAAMEKVQTRGKFRTFFFGPDFRNLDTLQNEVSDTRNRLDQLKVVAPGLESESDKSVLQSQITLMEQEQQKIEDFIKEEGDHVSLFGWLVKLFNK